MTPADHQRYRLGIVISSKIMTWAYYPQRLWNVCTGHCFAKEFSQKIFGGIFQARFAKGRVFKMRFSMRTKFVWTSFPYTGLYSEYCTKKLRREEVSYLKRQFSLNGCANSFIRRLNRRPTDTTMERQYLWQAFPYIANILEAVALRSRSCPSCSRITSQPTDANQRPGRSEWAPFGNKELQH